MNEEYIIREEDLDWFLDIWEEDRSNEDFWNPADSLPEEF